MSERILLSQGMDFLEKIIDLMEGQKETVGKLAKEVFRGIEPQILMIANTSGDPVTNDFLIQELNRLDDELNDHFPYIPDLKDYIQNVKKFLKFAIGRHFQKQQLKLDDAMVRALKMVGTQKMPIKAFYKPNKQKEEVKDYEG